MGKGLYPPQCYIQEFCVMLIFAHALIPPLCVCRKIYSDSYLCSIAHCDNNFKTYFVNLCNIFWRLRVIYLMGCQVLEQFGKFLRRNVAWGLEASILGVFRRILRGNSAPRYGFRCEQSAHIVFSRPIRRATAVGFCLLQNHFVPVRTLHRRLR